MNTAWINLCIDAELINIYGWVVGLYEHAGDVVADNEAPVMYHRILWSARYDDEFLCQAQGYKHNHNHD